MDSVILVRYGEIGIKGNNKSSFEEKLISQIKSAVHKLGKFKITKSQSRIYVEPLSENINLDEVIESMRKLFGIVSLSIVDRVESDFEIIKEKALEQIKKANKGTDISFKVETRRGDKSFKYNSQEVSREVGGFILENFPSLKVDVHNPDITIYIEIREMAYIYSQIIPAAGGMPTGTNGKATLLLSGGIDSPVAGYMVAKRGVVIDAVHFYSFPYTSERAKEKVIELAKILAQYCGKINLFIVPFTTAQLTIHEKCPDEQMTIIMRRLMMQIAEKIAVREGSSALITGESIGQVASQTMQSLYVTDAAVNMPVFRPLIGMDKVEIVEYARKINTFETSILPYEDCCTVFVPRHPKTKPQLEKILLSEKHIPVEAMIEEAVRDIELITISR